MPEPFIIQHSDREAIITGSRVQIFKVHQRNKKKPLRVSEWPDTDMVSPLKAWNVALLWTKDGFIDDDLTRH